MRARVNAYAKLNLTLDITGVADGFHRLDSLVTTIDVFDVVTATKRRDKLVTVEMHGCGCELLPYEQNNAARAAEAFLSKFGTTGADIAVYKNIPVGAGMGGSSADAAGVLNALSKLYGVEEREETVALANALGSDTAYMLDGGYARLNGRGDRVKRIESDLKLYFMILKPKGGVSTAACYKLYDEMRADGPFRSGAAEACLLAGDAKGLCGNLNNMLYAPACKLNGEVKTAYEEAAWFSPLGVNMTGSGSAVYAVFENAEFCRWAQSRYRGKADVILAKTILPE